MHSEEVAEQEVFGLGSLITRIKAARAVKQLYISSSALGICKICPKLFNALDVIRLSWLARLCHILWTLETVLLELHTGVVVPLFKKGRRKEGECDSSISRTLPSVPLQKKGTHLFCHSRGTVPKVHTGQFHNINSL